MTLTTFEICSASFGMLSTLYMGMDLESFWVFMLWDALDMNNFYFLFLLFSDFIGILFSFSFYFLSWTMKRHVTSKSHD